MEEKETNIYEIKKAQIKESLCLISYELLSDPIRGDIIKHKGVHYVHTDLEEAFKRLNVFLAHIDEAYKGFSTNKTTITELENKEQTEKYTVVGFSITGKEESRSVILTGVKEVEYGYIKFDTPKIMIEGGNYFYLEEISERINNAINEVIAYLGGKKAPEPVQSSIDFDEMDLDVF